ncbi:MAG: 3-isopropylmalate dehydrogenase [Armatimonadetes bacterium CG2_30_59_28]|nr:3-isopropylmalate dehydrogenase [Armatimonadota bacterium]OIO95884.1 MAG: 3-isopropylmalate dehydrogenase [Armatimonadetes bacterium CG2_30_59_28]PIU67428.1 MAG: 3-isopropylmalate dehydrogenase [Armatimonadetes bacterium CG07_land_8_20_14_0_80_59_28]PIX41386.1 MAG: 3-isopropylmalate dehydrogenase [Armatimonadetes bacterium CG_4_8_14_3_um_filter_58_9]PIY48854.1 MAG: 3-isopropylmalate dehydrogenase [Armatimonadetes bacterium CG_4_10_14_3_um_filter_59_10]PJB68340.1 MAG: 3-isopropylmalate dehyd
MYKIAVIPGDGTGPEVIREALKVADTATRFAGIQCEYEEFDFGGDRFLRTGEALPDTAANELSQFDAILLGAVGHPDVAPGILEKGILLRLRFELDQYINLRPVKLYPNVDCPLKDKGPEHIDFVVIRENTEGLYGGMGGFQYKGTPQEVSTQVHLTTRFGAERAIRFAFDVARKRDRMKQLHLVGKTNVLTFVHDTWWRAFNEVGEADYPDIRREYAHVDATCMWFVKNPEWFDVIVVENMFGDIITDLGAMIQGGMGIAAGGNINPAGVSMFEPIGGSAPKYTAQNVINPLACICAVQMMFEQLGEEEAAASIEKAVVSALESGKIKSMSAGRMGMSTTEIGDFVASLVA